MRKLVINEADLKMHKATYSAPIEEILDSLANGVTVKKVGRTKDRKPIDRDWLKVETGGEKTFYDGVLKLYQKKNFLTMELSGLVELCKGFDKLYRPLLDTERNIVDEVLKKIFNYEKFGEGKKLEKVTINNVQCYTWTNCAETWSAWHFIKHLNVRACCYCNAETIFSLLLDQPCPGVKNKRSNGRTKKDYKRSALDHYIGHSEYPAFGLSLYNLVPACTRCNTNIRGAKVLDYHRNIRPYEESFDDFFRFKYLVMKPGVEFQDLTEDDIGLIVSRLDKDGCIINVDKRGMNTAEFFHLKEVYNQLHRSEAIDTIRRYTLIPEARRKELEQHYPNIGRVVLERMLWGVDRDRNNINQYRLGKLTLDLLEQLGATSRDELDRIWQQW